MFASSSVWKPDNETTVGDHNCPAKMHNTHSLRKATLRVVYHSDTGRNGGLEEMVMVRQLLAVCLLTSAGALALGSGVGFADTAKPVLNAKAKRGQAVFQQNCVSCHNKQPDDTTAFGPPNLHGIFSSKPMVNPPVTPAQATDVIKNGKAPMPAFGSILSEAQISDLIAYLKAQ
jgi:mono/diheme cytochrome c family protein